MSAQYDKGEQTAAIRMFEGDRTTLISLIYYYSCTQSTMFMYDLYVIRLVRHEYFSSTFDHIFFSFAAFGLTFFRAENCVGEQKQQWMFGRITCAELQSRRRSAHHKKRQ